MVTSNHNELITVLTELYTLLVSLAAISDTQLFLPSPETGLHAPGDINTTSALAAGYDAETVALMCALPYVGEIGQQGYASDIELLSNAYTLNYLGADRDVMGFKGDREMLDDGKTIEVMPSRALAITWSEGRDGLEFIYDLNTRLVTPWRPFDTPVGVNNYFGIPAISPREAFGPIVEDYRKLKHIGTGDLMDWDDEETYMSGGIAPVGQGYTARDALWYGARYREYIAVHGLKDLYLECGWDVDAVNQTRFRRAEFVEKRQKYWEDVVEVVIKQNEIERDEAMASDREVSRLEYEARKLQESIALNQQ
ncbi:hypothetical protein LTR27_009764 [Elasticomyces elasticus]|nr:hypothetical protein LTR27_009764 [Elasticomyces elasticus]